MPGLIENHSHRQSDFGEQQGRAFLAYGITTLRNPGDLPYEAVEDREAGDAGIRLQPRIFDTGHLMEWKRTYYKMGTAISSNAHLMRELERGRILGFDLFKSYVRMPDIQQKMIVDFAHSHRQPRSPRMRSIPPLLTAWTVRNIPAPPAGAATRPGRPTITPMKT